VIGMLVLLLVVLPYYHCYRTLANTREHACACQAPLSSRACCNAEV
jgi:hypothetical protein